MVRKKKKKVIKKKIVKRTNKTIKRKKRKGYNASQVKEDAKQRRKFDRGGRIEAYTFGEAL